MTARAAWASALCLALFAGVAAAPGGASPAGRAGSGGYRGPNRDGVHPATGLLRKWPKDGPKLLWTFPTDLGRVWDEATVLRAAYAYEETAGFKGSCHGKEIRSGG